MDEQSKKTYEQLHITAAEHPNAFAPHVIILNIVMSVLGAIIGLELIVRTGVAPNTSIVGALFAIILSRIPLKFLQKYRSIHSQNNRLATLLADFYIKVQTCAFIYVLRQEMRIAQHGGVSGRT